MKNTNFLKQIFDIEDNAHNHIISLFEKHNVDELVLSDEDNEIVYFNEKNDVRVEKVELIRIGVFSEDDIVFQTTLDNYVSTDMCVRGTIAQYVPIIEQEFNRMRTAIETQANKIQREEFTSSKRYFFLPDSKNPRDLTPEEFCGRAFMHGEVMTAEEYADRFNSYQLGNIHPDFGTLKMYDYTDHIVEMCPHCENEVVLDTKYCKQRCPICNRLIKPCSMCADCISPCPLGEDE
jgi:hypothetical protein